MKRIIKLSSLMIVLLCTFLLTSCEGFDLYKPSWNNMKKITYSELLSKNHDYYYVLFYSPDCEYCEQILPVAIEFSKDDNNYPLYVLNTDDVMNNDGIMADEGYQYFSYIGTENYQDVVLENVPAFIVVDHNKVELLISSQTTDQVTSEIIYWLEND